MKAKHNLFLSVVIFFAIVLSQLTVPDPAKAACGGIVYVSPSGNNTTGCSWTNAFTTIQSAIAVATSGDQIWVAAGTYYPDEGTGQVNNDRNSAYALTAGVSIYGGFTGIETLLSQRNSNPATNNTILSGDIDQVAGNANNAYHVVTVAGALTDVFILDGFTVTNGNDSIGAGGAAVHITDSSPTLRNLIITNNASSANGGGLFVTSNATVRTSYSAPVIDNVTFSNNTAARGGGMYLQNGNPVLTSVTFTGNSATGGAGGGINSQTLNIPGDEYSIPVLTDVVFTGNTATGGGGMFVTNSNAVLNRVLFDSNTATRRGGGMLIEIASPSLTNVTFYGNISTETAGAAPRGGGAIMNVTGNPTINNATFSGNNSLTVGGDAIRNATTSNPVIRNSIFWGDVNDEITSDGTGSTTISDSVVQGGFVGGTNIITTNPLLSALANNGGYTQTMAIGVGSSAIDTGNNATCASVDQRNVARPIGTACDIGAYEFQGATTLTVSAATGTYGGTVNLSATLDSGGTGVSGRTVSFTLNGTSVGSAVTNGSGVATLNNVSLAGINAGTYLGGIGSGVGASFAGDGTYNASSGTATLTVNKRTITVTAATDTKVYNGNNLSSGIPTITSGTLATGDTVTWTQTFDNKNVGINKVLTPAGTVSDGNGGNNYTVTYATNNTGVITAASLTVTGITANNKVYDGNATATLNTGGATLVGVIGLDVVTLNTGSATGTFSDKNVGIGKTVSVAGLTLGGADAGNYTLTQPTTTANITAATLTVTGITANNKVYDGNTTVTLNTSGATLVGVIGLDSVTLNTAGATGTFSDKNVGAGKTVSIAGLTLGGTDAGNYTLTQPTTTANITAATLTVTGITANNKVYDGNATATLNTGGATLVGVIGLDTVTLNTAGATGTFSDKNVGVGKTVTISGLTTGGTDSGNYTLTQPTTTANITAATLTITGITANNKVYDGNTTATLNTGGATLVGVIGLDNVTLNIAGATGTFSDKNVGVGKTVSIAGLTIGGTDAGNYSLTQPTTTANITAATLTVTGITANNKVYDANANATLNTGGATLVGVIGLDNVTLNTAGATGTFSDANIGVGKTVTISGLTIGGTDSGNYTLTQPTTTANITAASLTVTGITANNKVYDGNTTATLNTGGATLVGVIGLDVVTLNTGAATGTFSDKNVGVGKTVTVSGLTLSGANAGNYTLTQPTTTANITAATLTVTGITANNKVYDGNTTATLNTGGATLVGVIGLDNVTLNTGGATGTFSDKNVGIGKTVTITGLTIGGTDSGNYTLTQPTTTANITAATLTVTGITANNKVYDGNTTATLNTGSATLVGVIGLDNVTLNTAGATGTFSDKNVGVGKTVTVAGLTLGGTDAGNYTLTQPTTTANITAATLTVSGITASNKIYDGTTTATLNTGSAALVGVFGLDNVTLNTASATGTFADKHVGVGKTVTMAGLTIGGTDSGNYTLTQPTTTASITTRAITITAVTDTKVYDGTTSSVGVPTITSGTLAPGDSVTWTQTFNNKNVGINKILTPAGTVTDGNSGNNYNVTFAANNTGVITAASLTVTGITANNKVYNGNATATLNTGGATLVGVIGLDNVTLNTAGATGTFSDKNVGVGKTVTVSGLTLGGTDAGNYTLTQPTTTANITAATLTVTGITANNKVYDGNATATLNTGSASLVGAFGADNVTLNTAGATGTFSDKNVGIGKTVTVASLTLGGTDAGNYTLTQPTTTANITAATLTVTGITANNKVYDGNTTATLNTGGATLVGVIGLDNVTLNTAGATGTFSDPNVGVGKTVTVLGLTLGGTDAGNYTLTQPTTTANITGASLTVTGITANNKVYDGTTTATLNTGSATLVGVIGLDNVTLNVVGATGIFATDNVGVGITVTVAGLTLSGADAGKYTLIQPTTTANITVRPITVTAVTDTKAYDTTTSSTGVPTITSGSLAAGDTVTWTQTFDTPNVGTNKVLTPAGTVTDGNGGANYNVTFATNNTGVITGLTLTVTGITANNKVYDGNTTATLNTGGATLVGVQPGDVVTLNVGGATGTFANKNVGTAKTVSIAGLTLGGADAGNYSLTQPSTTADITTRAITVTASTDTKVYDGTTSSSAAPTVTTGTLAPGDSLNFTQTFDTKHVGAGKTLTAAGSVNDGNNGNNYNVTLATDTTGQITARLITVTAVTSTKGYDGTTTSSGTPTITSGSLAPGDSASWTQTFTTPDVGTGKTLTPAGTVTDGNTGNNYNVTFANNTTGVITSATLTVIADNQSKVVGAVDPTFTFTYTGFIPPDTAAVVDTPPTCTVAVPHTNAGTYPITCSGGVDNNYAFTYVNGTLTIGAAIQTITIVTGAPVTTLLPGATFTVAATASSGLPVTYTASGACTNVGALFTMNANAPGICTVTYSQTGNSNYNPAPALTETVATVLVVATNGINTASDTGDGTLIELEVATVNINQLIVTFNKDVSDPAGNTGTDDVTNPANYILVSDNGDGIQTATCTTGVTGGDTVIPINSVVYNNSGGTGPFVATVNVNGGTALPVGTYRFIVCGTTSIVDLTNQPLAGNGAVGTDFTRNFSVANASITAPKTGFPQGEVTTLAAQPADKAYTNTDLWLEIPKINVKLKIVGVPLGKDGWDVSWLGNNAGWLNGTAFPTWQGNSVITAHVWDANNKPGPFARLKELKYGDSIIIRAYGQIYTYSVTESLLIAPTDTTSMLKHSDKPTLTLITCEEYLEKSRKYSHRRMVRALLISTAKEK